jgi:WD40 repeat protein
MQDREQRLPKVMSGWVASLAAASLLVTVALGAAAYFLVSSLKAEQLAARNAAAAMAGLSEAATERLQYRRAAILALAAWASDPEDPPSERIVSVFDVANSAAVTEPVQAHDYLVSAIAFSPDGNLIVSGGAGDFNGNDVILRQWNPVLEPVKDMLLTDEGLMVNDVAFSPDGRRILSGDSAGRLRLWDTAKNEPFSPPIPAFDGSVAVVAFAPNGCRFVSGGQDLLEEPDDPKTETEFKTLRLWDAATFQPIGQHLRGHTEVVSAVAFSPDGSQFASGGDDGKVRLWKTNATGAVFDKLLTSHEAKVRSIAYSPDGKSVASSGGGYGTILLSNAASGKTFVWPLGGEDESVISVVFSPDGSSLASGGEDSKLRLLDSSSGVALGKPLIGHADRINSVVFSPDGRHIVSGGEDGTVRLWDVARHFGPDRVNLLCDALQPIRKSEIDEIESETGLTLPEICTPAQRAEQLPAIWVPGPPIAAPVIDKKCD